METRHQIVIMKKSELKIFSLIKNNETEFYFTKKVSFPFLNVYVRKKHL